jgi:hypothetical protein
VGVWCVFVWRDVHATAGLLHPPPLRRRTTRGSSRRSSLTVFQKVFTVTEKVFTEGLHGGLTVSQH